MTTRLVLDSSVLGRLCHPRQSKNRPFVDAVFRLLRSVKVPTEICLPAIADYELRRKLLHLIGTSHASQISLQRLNQLCGHLAYVELTTSTLRLAAEFWAELRTSGRATSSGDSLDADVILAAQAQEIGGWVVTSNVRHLVRMVPVIAPDLVADATACMIPDRPGITPPTGFQRVPVDDRTQAWVHPNHLPPDTL